MHPLEEILYLLNESIYDVQGLPKVHARLTVARDVVNRMLAEEATKTPAEV